MEKIYVIGDVHGCYFTLCELLEKIPKDSRIIFTGDLCDRGLYSKDVIELVMNEGYECVLGNHDFFMYDIGTQLLNREVKEKWWFEDKIGGKQTVASYKRDMETFKKHIDFLKTLPLYIEIDNFFITHGFGLPFYNRRQDVAWDKKVKNALIYNRVEDQEKYGHEWEKGWQNYPVFNVFGHSPYKVPKFAPNYCGIDTGAVYGGKLSALHVNTKEVISVEVVKKDMP